MMPLQECAFKCNWKRKTISLPVAAYHSSCMEIIARILFLLTMEVFAQLQKEELLLQEANKDGIRQRMADMVAFLQSEPEEVTEYSESLVRRMIEKITVYDDHFVVEFKSGIEITINE